MELGLWFQSLEGFRIPWAVFRFQSPGFRIPESLGRFIFHFSQTKEEQIRYKITDKEVNNCRILNWYRINLHLSNSQFGKTGNVLEMEDVRFKGRKTAVSPSDHTWNAFLLSRTFGSLAMYSKRRYKFRVCSVKPEKFEPLRSYKGTIIFRKLDAI